MIIPAYGKVGYAGNVIQIVLLLVVISCMPGETQTLDDCYDAHGNPLPPWGVYYDGVNWRPCWSKHTGDQRQILDFMEQKWKIFFQILDSNNDGMITKEDIATSKERYTTVLSPRDRISLDKFWHCILLDTYRFPPRVTEAEFIASYRNAFDTHKATGAKRMEKCTEYISETADVNKDGFLSFEELLGEFKTWNLDNEKLTQEIFNRMKPNNDNLVPVENVGKFYAEIWFGDLKYYDIHSLHRFNSTEVHHNL